MPVGRQTELTALVQLARRKGLQTSYFNVEHQRVMAEPQSLLAILKAIGTPLSSPGDAAEAMRQHDGKAFSNKTEPVLIAWDGHASPLPLRTAPGARGRIECALQLEDGTTREWAAELDQMPVSLDTPEGRERLLQLDDLPMGYHRLRLRGAGFDEETLIISAPTQAFEANDGRRWGVFLPLYALHVRDSWGAGDYTDLATLAEWLQERGGDILATLPLLPAFLDGPRYSASPYSPVSRLMWNEFYVDPRRALQADDALVASSVVQAQVEKLRSSPVVDYREGMALKQRLLSAMASTPSGRKAVEAKAASDPDVAGYARFRAAMQRTGKVWHVWPQAMRNGQLGADDIDNEAFAYYVYAQMLADSQLDAAAREARGRNQGFYLDVPIGSNPDGYDVWRFRDTFALGASCGAPPDAVFTGGQDWGFPPAHPQAQRRTGYEFLRRLVRHHLRFANVLRLDHVMGLHRLFWVPAGGSAKDGVYVRYPADELYALLSLESHRNKATLVGENLGTVPLHINRALSQHNIYQTWVLQYELPGNNRRMKMPPRRSFASLNTHDMPPYASFLTGSDIDLRESRKLITPELATQERAFRARQLSSLKTLLSENGLAPQTDDPKALFEASLKYVAASPARYVIVNLEDTWQETEPQNIPGTVDGNWEKKAARDLEDFPVLNVDRSVRNYEPESSTGP